MGASSSSSTSPSSSSKQLPPPPQKMIYQPQQPVISAAVSSSSTSSPLARTIISTIFKDALYRNERACSHLESLSDCLDLCPPARFLAWALGHDAAPPNRDPRGIWMRLWVNELGLKESKVLQIESMRSLCRTLRLTAHQIRHALRQQRYPQTVTVGNISTVAAASSSSSSSSRHHHHPLSLALVRRGEGGRGGGEGGGGEGQELPQQHGQQQSSLSSSSSSSSQLAQGILSRAKAATNITSSSTNIARRRSTLSATASSSFTSLFPSTSTSTSSSSSSLQALEIECLERIRRILSPIEMIRFCVWANQNRLTIAALDLQ